MCGVRIADSANLADAQIGAGPTLDRVEFKRSGAKRSKRTQQAMPLTGP
jgi:hypothetical protein